jgi:hypothetical protein
MMAALAALGMAWALAMTGLGTASAAETVWCTGGHTATWTYGSVYYGSAMVGHSKVVNASCAYVQASVTYVASASAGVQTVTGVKTTATSAAYAGNNNWISATYYLW